MGGSEGAFWGFSLALYGRPGVPQACLALQDGDGADVSVVLYALWCGARGCVLDREGLARAEGVAVLWRDEVLRPLRAARRACKPVIPPIEPAAAEALRRTLMQAELEAERLQQQAMEQAAPPGQEGVRAVEENVACLARYLGIAGDAAPLAVLAGAVA